MSSALLTDPPTYQPAVLADQAQATRPVAVDHSPVFLVGAERSGTTLLRLMLDHHPKVAFQYESEFMVEHIGDDGEMPDPQQVISKLATDRIFQSTGFSSDVSGGYARMAHDWLEQKRIRGDKPIIGATIHTHFHRIPHLWPNARYIHLVRDGRDVARSCVQMGWYGNAYAASDHWLEALACWDRLCEAVPSDRRMAVRYEQLITHPVDTLTAICDFLGVVFDQKIFSYIDQSTYSYPDPKLIHQWINKMPEAEVAALEGKIGTALQVRGYKLSGHTPVRLSPSKEKQVYRRSNLGRRMFQIKRFGLKLFILDNIVRRLKLKKLQDRVRLQMNAIEEQHLK